MKVLQSKYGILILLSSFIVVVFAALRLLSSGDEMAFVSANLYLTYFLVSALVVLVLGFSVKQLLRNKKSLLVMAIGVVGLATLFGVSYATATGSLEGLNISVSATPFEVQFVGAITTATIALVLLGMGVLVFMELKKLLQNG